MALMVSADHLRTAVVVETIIIFKRKRHAALPAVTQVHNQEGNNSYNWLNLANRRVIRVHELLKALFFSSSDSKVRTNRGTVCPGKISV